MEELKTVSNKFIEQATERLEQVYHNKSTDGNQITRTMQNVELWGEYLTNEANPEAKRFVDEINSPKYAHILEEDKIAINDEHREKLKDLIYKYNRKVILNEE